MTAQAAFDLSGTSVNDRQPAWIVGGELRWNLSLGGAELARSKAASHAQVRAAAAADDIRAAVRVEVVTAFRRLEAARARQAVGGRTTLPESYFPRRAGQAFCRFPLGRRPGSGLT